MESNIRIVSNLNSHTWHCRTWSIFPVHPPILLRSISNWRSRASFNLIFPLEMVQLVLNIWWIIVRWAKVRFSISFRILQSYINLIISRLLFDTSESRLQMIDWNTWTSLTNEMECKSRMFENHWFSRNSWEYVFKTCSKSMHRLFTRD